ncbi:MAG TPA: bifunctional phosphoglucose/phosphomannose isomerase [Saprospiraceae bacterium]|nr:bifunctional phosphoglucose/phosphomannose isomerase [Saprospiraceae bacterium]
MKTMIEMIQAFPAQLEEALAIGKQIRLNAHDQAIHKVYVAGMGGSGIGGDFVASLVMDECRVPVLVGKSYEVPAYIDGNTLVILSSYSGNTEETLTALERMKNFGAKFICVSSGGELLKQARERQLDFVQLPSGWSSPRACLGFSLVSQLCILNKMALIGDGLLEDLESAIQLLKLQTPEIVQTARQLAGFMEGKMPVIYSIDRMEPVAVRFRQQVNENSKMLCWHHVLPEMNHNELVGWRWTQNALAVLFLRNADENPRIQVRMELTKEIVSHYTQSVLEVYSKGESLAGRCLYMVHLLDYVSVYLAEFNQVDAVEVRVIDFLKTELSKQ